MKNIVIKTTVLLVWLGCGFNSYSQSASIQGQRIVNNFADSLLKNVEHLDATGKVYCFRDCKHDQRVIDSFARVMGAKIPIKVFSILTEISNQQKQYGSSINYKIEFSFLKKLPVAAQEILPLLWIILLSFAFVFTMRTIKALQVWSVIFYRWFISILNGFSVSVKQIYSLFVTYTLKQEWCYCSRRWGDIVFSIDHIPLFINHA